MNFKAKLKLILGVLGVAIFCAGLLVYTNAQFAKVGSANAAIEFSKYSVGTEFDGIITRQYVESADAVAKDEPLFEISSDTLKQQIANETIDVASLNYDLTAENNLVITAQRAGSINTVNFPVGSFVRAGDIIATVNNASETRVLADFYLSGPQYQQLSPDSPVTVTLAGGKIVKSTIRGISQKSKDGKTITTIIVLLPTLDSSQAIYSSGAPVSTTVVLNTDTYFDRLKRAAIVFGL